MWFLRNQVNLIFLPPHLNNLQKTTLIQMISVLNVLNYSALGLPPSLVGAGAGVGVVFGSCSIRFTKPNVKGELPICYFRICSYRSRWITGLMMAFLILFDSVPEILKLNWLYTHITLNSGLII